MSISRIIGAVILLLASILHLASASAGVVTEERITAVARTGPGSVRNCTLKLQGDKEKLQIDEHVSMVIDVNNRTVTISDSVSKTFRELPLRNVTGTTVDPNRSLYVDFKRTDKTRELLGLKCRDYTGVRYEGPLMTATTACFSTAAAGSDDFSRFLKLVVLHSRYPKGTISIPPGMPLLIESTRGVNPTFAPPDISQEEAAKFKSRIAKAPPQITRIEVTKITSEKLSPDLFNTPAGYTRSGREPD